MREEHIYMIMCLERNIKVKGSDYMKQITIVTAFFDINRSSMKGFNRSNQKYIEAFKFWARIKNKIVVFSDRETINEVIKIRKEFGLLDKTETIVIDDYIKIDEELFKSIDYVMNKKEFLDFHLQRKIPEAVSSKYNYIMSIKSWCCAEAVKRGLTTEMVAWLDFGFNYGGRFYKNTEEFNFLWEYNFSDKIHLFQVNEFDALLPFEIIKRNNSYVQGGEIVAPDYMWKELWQLVRNNMLALNKSGLADDDQILYLMSYREKSEFFEIHKCEWLGLFKHFSNKNFNFEVPKVNRIKCFIYKCLHPTEFIWIRKLIYSIRVFIILLKSKQKK